MKITNIRSDADIAAMKQLVQSLGEMASVVDFEEVIQLESVRANTRLWSESDSLIAFAYVDDFNNLWFEVDPDFASDKLENEFIAWGVECIRRRNAFTGEQNTLDICVQSKHKDRIKTLELNGFIQLNTRSLNYSRSLAEPVELFPLPSGFTWRCVNGENEVQDLVNLHQAAFGTDNMTVEGRLTIMRSPDYASDLDLVVVAPDGSLVAFCVCNLQRGNEKGIAYTEPIGTHPRYHRFGLGKAILSIALRVLQAKGCETVGLGTSSENVAMQRLAETLGFELVSENIWFAKNV